MTCYCLLVYKTASDRRLEETDLDAIQDSIRGCVVVQEVEDPSLDRCNRIGCGQEATKDLDFRVDVTDPFGIAWAMRDRSNDPMVRINLCDNCYKHLLEKSSNKGRILVGIKEILLTSSLRRCTFKSLKSLIDRGAVAPPLGYPE